MDEGEDVDLDVNMRDGVSSTSSTYISTSGLRDYPRNTSVDILEDCLNSLMVSRRRIARKDCTKSQFKQDKKSNKHRKNEKDWKERNEKLNIINSDERLEDYNNGGKYDDADEEETSSSGHNIIPSVIAEQKDRTNVGNRKYFVVGISGSISTGKTTLAQNLHKELIDSKLIHLDDYYIECGATLRKSLGGNSIRWKDFMRDIKTVCTEAAQPPIPRRPDVDIPVVVLLDGLYLFSHPEAGRICDVRLLLEASKQECFSRHVLKINSNGSSNATGLEGPSRGGSDACVVSAGGRSDSIREIWDNYEEVAFNGLLSTDDIFLINGLKTREQVTQDALAVIRRHFTQYRP